MNKIKSIYKKNEEVTRLLVIMAVWLIFMAFTQARKFYTGMNFLTMAGQFPEYGLMALGGMLCMITGGIDLSVVGTQLAAYHPQVVSPCRSLCKNFLFPASFLILSNRYGPKKYTLPTPSPESLPAYPEVLRSYRIHIHGQCRFLFCFFYINRSFIFSQTDFFHLLLHLL